MQLSISTQSLTLVTNIFPKAVLAYGNVPSGTNIELAAIFTVEQSAKSQRADSTVAW